MEYTSNMPDRTAHPTASVAARVVPGGAEELTGRRERKKRRQHDAIVAVAHDLFRRHGYENVSMDSIAERADVAASTLYNYFPTKRSILLAISHQDVRRLAANADRYLARLADDPLKAFCDQLRREWADVVTPPEKHLWAHLLSASILSFGRGEDGGYQASRDGYTAFIARVLERLVARGRLRTEVDIHLMAQAIYAIWFDCFRTYVADEVETLASVIARVRAQLEVLLAGWRTDR